MYIGYSSQESVDQEFRNETRTQNSYPSIVYIRSVKTLIRDEVFLKTAGGISFSDDFGVISGDHIAE